MELMRDKVKDKFKTGDKPTQQDFALLIDSGFNLYKMDYNPDYPYEEGNIVFVVLGNRWRIYRRKNYDIGAKGKPVTDGRYWQLVSIGVYAGPRDPDQPGTIPSSGLVMAVLNSNGQLITHSSKLTEEEEVVPVIIVKGSMLRFEERGYNIPGINRYSWEIKKGDVLVAKYDTRDAVYSFDEVGAYTVSLTANEADSDEELKTEYQVSVVDIPQGSMAIEITADKSHYSYIGEKIKFNVRVINTGNYILSNVVVNFNLGFDSIQIPQIAIGASSPDIPLEYIVKASDLSLSFIKLTANATATGYGNQQVTASSQLMVGNGVPVLSFTSFTIMPRRGYLSRSVDIQFTATTNSNINPVNVEYIRLYAIANGVQSIVHTYSTYQDINQIVSGNTINFTRSYTVGTNVSSLSFMLMIKITGFDAQTSQYATFVPVTQLAITAFANAVAGQFTSFYFNLNRLRTEFDIYEYKFYEKKNDSEYVLIPSSSYTVSTLSNGSTRVTFTSSFGPLEEDSTLFIRVVETLKPDANNQSMTVESNFRRYATPQVYWGALTNNVLMSLPVKYAISRYIPSTGYIVPIPEDCKHMAGVGIEELKTNILTASLITETNNQFDEIEVLPQTGDYGYENQNQPNLRFQTRFEPLLGSSSAGYFFVAFPPSFPSFTRYTENALGGTTQFLISDAFLKFNMLINNLNYTVYIHKGSYRYNNNPALEVMGYNPVFYNITFRT